MDPAKGDSNSNDLVEVISNESNFYNSTDSLSPILGDLVIDSSSINIQGKKNYNYHLMLL